MSHRTARRISSGAAAEEKRRPPRRPPRAADEDDDEDAPAAAAAKEEDDDEDDDSSKEEEENDDDDESDSDGDDADSKSSASIPPHLHVVESILNERTRRGHLEYEIRWEGYGEETTWEREENLTECTEAMAIFRKQQLKAKKGAQTAASSPAASSSSSASTAAAAARARRPPLITAPTITTSSSSNAAAASPATSSSSASSSSSTKDKDKDKDKDKEKATSKEARHSKSKSSSTSAADIDSIEPGTTNQTTSVGLRSPLTSSREGGKSTTSSVSKKPTTTIAAKEEGGILDYLDESKEEKHEEPGSMSFVLSANNSPGNSATVSPAARAAATQAASAALAAAAAAIAPSLLSAGQMLPQLVLEYEERECWWKDDSYTKYWTHSAHLAQQQLLQQSAPTSSSSFATNPNPALSSYHLSLPAADPPLSAQNFSSNGVSPCKIQVVNPVYDPLEQLATTTRTPSMSATQSKLKTIEEQKGGGVSSAKSNNESNDEIDPDQPGATPRTKRSSASSSSSTSTLSSSKKSRALPPPVFPPINNTTAAATATAAVRNVSVEQSSQPKWAEDEERSWEWSKSHLWNSQVKSTFLDEDAASTVVHDLTRSNDLSDEEAEIEEPALHIQPAVLSSHPPDKVHLQLGDASFDAESMTDGDNSIPSIDPSAQPTIQLNGTEYVFVPTLPTVQRPPLPSEVEDEPPPDARLPPSPDSKTGPSLPASPFITPPLSSAHSPVTMSLSHPSDVLAAAEKGALRLDLNAPRSRRSVPGSSSRTLSPPATSITATIGSGGRGPVRLSATFPASPAAGIAGSMALLPPSGPRLTRSGSEEALTHQQILSPNFTRGKASKQGVSIDISTATTPVSARANSQGHHGATTASAATTGQLKSPYSNTFGLSSPIPRSPSASSTSAHPSHYPVSALDDETLHREELRLNKRKGHLSSAESQRLKQILARKKQRGLESMLSPTTTAIIEAFPASAEENAETSKAAAAAATAPAASSSSSSSAAPMNRRERRQLAREQGTLVQKSVTPVPDAAGAETPTRRSRSSTATPTPSDRTSVTTPTPSSSAAAPSRPTRSQVDLSNVLLTPKDWPGRTRWPLDENDQKALIIITPKKRKKKAEDEETMGENTASDANKAAKLESDSTSTPSAAAAAAITPTSATPGSHKRKAAASVASSPSSAQVRDDNKAGQHSHSTPIVQRTTTTAKGRPRVVKMELDKEEEDDDEEDDDDDDKEDDDDDDDEDDDEEEGQSMQSTGKDPDDDASEDVDEEAAVAAAATPLKESPLKKQKFTNNAAASSSSSAVARPTSSSPNQPIYGNYPHYYNYRNPISSSSSSSSSSPRWSDPRFNLFQPVWFNNKTVLDLGCNAGLISILLASSPNFHCKKVIGVDLDGSLIVKAKELVQQRVAAIQQQQQQQQQQQSANSTPRAKAVVQNLLGSNQSISVLSGAAGGSNTAAATGSGSTHAAFRGAPVSSLSRFQSPSAVTPFTIAAAQKNRSGSPATSTSTFPANITFEQCDVSSGALCSALIAPASSVQPTVDVILCLSLTKWIHFHHGDQGIKDLFARIHRSLPKGGLCILEPQPFATYKGKIRLSQTIKDTYNKIQFKPEEFPAYLQKTYGWHLKHNCSLSREDATQQSQEGKGTSSAAAAAASSTPKTFTMRPLYVFEKK